ncbi:hypothetical protein [Corynebacterium coyleae]|nr:hypothetical protein [Corynebacterium coyleae]MDK8242148.1 hypothetical protein [Corynebacterium coyleae]
MTLALAVVYTTLIVLIVHAGTAAILPLLLPVMILTLIATYRQKDTQCP